MFAGCCLSGTRFRGNVSRVPDKKLTAYRLTHGKAGFSCSELQPMSTHGRSAGPTTNVARHWERRGSRGEGMTGTGVRSGRVKVGFGPVGDFSGDRVGSARASMGRPGVTDTSGRVRGASYLG